MVVLPVPTSPVMAMNPLRLCTPYIRLARASSCCGLRKRNEGSGLMLNGFWVKPKKALYMFTRSWRAALIASYHGPDHANLALPATCPKPRLRSRGRRGLFALFVFFRFLGLLSLDERFHRADQHMRIAA